MLGKMEISETHVYVCIVSLHHFSDNAIDQSIYSDINAARHALIDVHNNVYPSHTRSSTVAERPRDVSCY